MTYLKKLAVPVAVGVALAVPSTATTYDGRWAAVAPYNAKLNRMARCESSGRWHIATGNGYYGGLQFSLRTWHSVGGRGYPHRASVLEQKYRAVRLIRRSGYGPWPRCGRV